MPITIIDAPIVITSAGYQKHLAEALLLALLLAQRGATTYL